MRRIVWFAAILLLSSLTLRGQNTTYVIDPKTEPGGDASAQLMAACAALPNGGTIDASSYGGTTQYISSQVSCGSEEHPVTFIFTSSTVFVPVGTATQMFTLVEGMTIRGTLFADVTSVPGWSGAVIGMVGSIWNGTYHSPNTAVENLVCRGNSSHEKNTSGSCIRLAPSPGNRVSFLRTGSTTVTGMAYGIQLVADDQGTGQTTNITGNWFEHLQCIQTGKCVSMIANGLDTSTQISLNHFPNMGMEFSDLPGFEAVYAARTSNGMITSNDFNGIVLFDFAAGSTTFDFGYGTQKNQVTGFLCTGICGDLAYKDNGSGNNISDTYMQGQLSTFMPFLTPSGTRAGYLTYAPTGITMGLEGESTSFRLQGGNGGLELALGVGPDHGVYLNSLDPQRRAIYFNSALAINGNIVLPSTVSGYQGSGTKVAIPIYGTATLAGGVVTVTNPEACAVSSTCVYKLTNCGTNGSTAIGTLAVGNVRVGSDFKILSLSSENTILRGDRSTVCWQIN